MQNLITSLCQVAIAINLAMLIVGILYNSSSLVCLSVINIALLGTRFLVFKGENQK